MSSRLGPFPLAESDDSMVRPCDEEDEDVHDEDDRGEKQRRLYVGPKWLADMLMDEIWRRREEAGTRWRPGNEPWRKKRSGAEGVSVEQILSVITGLQGRLRGS